MAIKDHTSSLVLLSGGVGSAVALWQEAERIRASKDSTLRVNAIHFSGNPAETRATLIIWEKFKARNRATAGELIISTALAGGGLPRTYITMTVLAASLHEQIKALTIYSGNAVTMNGTENAAEGRTVAMRLQATFRAAHPRLFFVFEQPYSKLHMPEVIEIALTLKGIRPSLAETYSCEEIQGPGTPGCGDCPHCLRRDVGFKLLGLKDPGAPSSSGRDWPRLPGV